MIYFPPSPQEAQKAANGQAAVLSHQDHQGAWDWRATITTA